jgi:hypothetical protein
LYFVFPSISFTPSFSLVLATPTIGPPPSVGLPESGFEISDALDIPAPKLVDPVPVDPIPPGPP